MQAKYSSTRDTMDDDGDTIVSVHSRTSSPVQWRDPGHKGPRNGGVQNCFSLMSDEGYLVQYDNSLHLQSVYYQRICEHRPPSSVWRPVALTLLPLCVVLLLGLLALGPVFFQFYQLSNTQQDSISNQEERLGNLSRQLQSLQKKNRKLAEILQHVAEKLCRELYNKTGEHRCSPCPEKWKWHGDKCYRFCRESKSWQGCEYFCIAENATMLKINTQEVLEFAMPQSYSEFFYSYWTGLSRNSSEKAWLWTDGAPYSSELFEIIIDFTSLRSRDCVTILNGKAFSKDCKELRRCACEQRAATVKLESLL